MFSSDVKLIKQNKFQVPSLFFSIYILVHNKRLPSKSQDLEEKDFLK